VKGTCEEEKKNSLRGLQTFFEGVTTLSIYTWWVDCSKKKKKWVELSIINLH